MIRIDIPGLTDRQRDMLNTLWNLDQLEDVEQWIEDQPTPTLRREAESMRELIFWAILATEMDTDLAEPVLDKIFR